VIPLEVQRLLQLGDRFGLPPFEQKKRNNVINFIKNVENNIQNLKLTEEINNNIRSLSVSVINKLFNETSLSHNDKNLCSMYNSTRTFLKKHPELLVTRADKGSITVALNKNKYIAQMEDMLSDSSTYEVINYDPTKKIINSLNSIISGWRKKDYIDMYTYRRIYCGDGNLPRAYGLPKIHKPNFPLRIIVSTINSPLFSFAIFLKNILQEGTEKSIGFVLNSYHLIKELNGFKMDPINKLASLDVTSLFTNVPIDRALESIDRDSISKNTSIPLIDFKMAVKFVLSSTFFSFNNNCYKQIFGTPMGSPLSPVIADLVMQDLELSAIRMLPINLPFYYRYVDDIILTAPSESLDQILHVFNAQHKRLQFTIETEIDKRISFLDLTFINKDGKLIFDIFHKPTFSGRYLSYYSHHPVNHKKGVIFGMTDKIIKLSHPSYHQKNLTETINLLLKNGYPLEFIFSNIHNRI